MGKTIGFVGTGTMGSRMIIRLLEEKHEVTLYNRNKVEAEPLIKKGASSTESIQDLVNSTDFICISVPDDLAIKQVMSQAVSVECKNKVFISLSTISPDAAVELSEAATKNNAYFLDCPVSGSAPQVEAAQLIIFVSGDEAKYKEAESIFSSISKETHYMGPAGNGSRIKLVVNTLLGLGVQALAESLTLGERMGLSKDKLIEILSNTAVVSPSQKIKMQNALSDNYDVAFSLSNMYKDFGLVLDQAHKTFTPMPATAASVQVNALGMSQNLNQDFSVVIKLLEESNVAK
ncbi:MAG TPA: NAD(P)-dependent oxidoreductase [Patescibacteria group bacterium]|jgi:3-hydroxyisobutyrate dehydrogenase-like beta-hydroxyacid dehydrogenase|nr:NAD(P)-dependent oxidoreductase [Patescibacteria group bacterium]